MFCLIVFNYYSKKVSYELKYFRRKFIACYFFDYYSKRYHKSKSIFYLLLLVYYSKRYHINLRRFFCLLLLVYYSIRDHTNENISSVNLLLVTFGLYCGGWEKIFNVACKYFDLYISILMSHISLKLAK